MFHALQATPKTCQWGYFDNSVPPVLTINSGDIVHMECLSHHAGDAPDLMFDSGVRAVYDAITPDQRGPGVHIVTGPIAISGADPGDALEVDFLEARPRLPYAVNFEANWGLLYQNARGESESIVRELEAKEHVFIYEADWDRGTARGYTQFPYPRSPMTEPGVVLTLEECKRSPVPPAVIPLRPHMGVAGVASAEPGRINSVPPGRFGGNVDDRNYVPGTRMLYPVQVPGALFWAGDTHFAEGDGEISGTAIEGHLNVTLRFILHKQLGINTPILETPNSIIVHGFHQNMDEAIRICAIDTIREMNRRWNLSPQECYSILSVGGDCHVSQVVNGTKGCHFIVSKRIMDTLSPRK